MISLREQREEYKHRNREMDKRDDRHRMQMREHSAVKYKKRELSINLLSRNTC